MTYYQTIVLKDGSEAVIRSAGAADGLAVYENFNRVHSETDFLLTYSDENSFDPGQEAEFLEEKAQNPRELALLALMGGKLMGTAIIEAVGGKDKVRHRAEFSISLLKESWGLGLGKALAEACIRCAREAGYEQLELTAVAENERALSLYRSLGFEEFGRNPTGFKPRSGSYQEVVYMLLHL